MKNIWIQRRKSYFIVDFTNPFDPYCPGDTLKEKFEGIYRLMYKLCGMAITPCEVVMGTSIAYLFEMNFSPFNGNWNTPFNIPSHKVGLINKRFDIIISSLVNEKHIYLTVNGKTKIIEVKNWMI